MNPTIDLNCDLGEGAAHDAELMSFISSANIACGAHAGDAATMRRTLELARQQGVSPGAHPGYRDRANFGRVEQSLSPAEVFRLVSEQIRELQQIAAESGVGLAHVKPHGALYNQAARHPELADAIASAVQAVDPRLIVVGLAGSALISAAHARGLVAAGEVFADRRYEADGSLTPRSRPDSMISDSAEACAQVMRFIREGRAQTICIHGDGPHAVTFARQLRAALREARIEVKPLTP